MNTEHFANGISLWQAPQTALRGPSMGYVFKTGTGKLICIDGGIKPETGAFIDYLSNTAVEGVSFIDGKIVIEGWFITHNHTDHIGVLNHIMKELKGKIVIKRVYYNFAPISHCEKDVGFGSSENDILFTQEFYDLINENDVPQTILNVGDVYEFDGLKLKVLFTYDLDIEKNIINNSSVVIKAETGKKSVLFLGDLGAEAGDKLLNSEYKNELKCDIVQMAHHGQGGVKEDFYRFTGAKIALWPTPFWLYATPTKMHDFLHCDIARRWLLDMGCTIDFIAKDGGITLS